MQPRPVDERDTMWEATALKIRIFIVRPRGRIDAFDFDSVRFSEAEQWARDQIADTELFSIALRQASPDDGTPGLLWIHDFAGLADAVAGLTEWVDRVSDSVDSCACRREAGSPGLQGND